MSKYRVLALLDVSCILMLCALLSVVEQSLFVFLFEVGGLSVVDFVLSTLFLAMLCYVCTLTVYFAIYAIKQL